MLEVNNSQKQQAKNDSQNNNRNHFALIWDEYKRTNETSGLQIFKYQSDLNFAAIASLLPWQNPIVQRPDQFPLSSVLSPCWPLSQMGRTKSKSARSSDYHSRVAFNQFSVDGYPKFTQASHGVAQRVQILFIVPDQLEGRGGK